MLQNSKKNSKGVDMTRYLNKKEATILRKYFKKTNQQLLVNKARTNGQWVWLQGCRYSDIFNWHWDNIYEVLNNLEKGNI